MSMYNAQRSNHDAAREKACRPSVGKPLISRALLVLLVLALLDAQSRASPTTPTPTTLLRATHEAVELLSYRELRYRDVVGQSNPYSCGPAAVATLLSRYLGLEAGEGEALRLAEASLTARGEDREQPLAALDLMYAMEAYGLEVRGYRVTAASLDDYFARGGVPVIAHVTKPQNHFVVIVGTLEDLAVLADPSWGTRVEHLSALEASLGFSGIVLVPLAEVALAERAQWRQRAVLGEVAQRLARLRSVQRSWPWAL